MNKNGTDIVQNIVKDTNETKTPLLKSPKGLTTPYTTTLHHPLSLSFSSVHLARTERLNEYPSLGEPSEWWSFDTSVDTEQYILTTLNPQKYFRPQS